MNLIKALTPQETEEVKPGVFLQRKGKTWRQIYPAAWNGKINWKNFILGPNFWKNFIWFVIIMFLIFSYWHDTNELREFHNTVTQNKIAWCAGVPLENLKTGDNDQQQNPLAVQTCPG